MEGLVIVCTVPRCLSSLHRHPPDSSWSTVDYDKSIWGVKLLDWGTVISSGCGGKLARDKRAFPRDPVTPSTTLVSAVRPSLRDKSVPVVKKKREGVRRKVGDALLFHHIPLCSTSGGLISLSGRAGNWQVTAEQSNNAIPLVCIANNAGDLINGREEKQGQINKSLAVCSPALKVNPGLAT